VLGGPQHPLVDLDVVRRSLRADENRARVDVAQLTIGRQHAGLELGGLLVPRRPRRVDGRPLRRAFGGQDENDAVHPTVTPPLGIEDAVRLVAQGDHLRAGWDLGGPGGRPQLVGARRQRLTIPELRRSRGGSARGESESGRGDKSDASS
jgi:hypothetical protein